MATHDRFPILPTLVETPTEAESTFKQGELFARLALRQLPIMKQGPEDEFVFTPPPTLH